MLKKVVIIFFLILLISGGLLFLKFRLDNPTVFTPKIPKDIQYIIINRYNYYDDHADNDCYVVANEKEIQSIIKSLKNISVHAECCLPGDLQNIYFIKDNLYVGSLYYNQNGYPDKAIGLIDGAKRRENIRKYYSFKVPRSIVFEDIELEIKDYQEEVLVFYIFGDRRTENSQEDGKDYYIAVITKEEIGDLTGFMKKFHLLESDNF